MLYESTNSRIMPTRTAKRSTGTCAVAHSPAQTLTDRCTHLRRIWLQSREESRKAAADAQKVRQESRELVKQWNQVVAQTSQLRLTSRSSKTSSNPTKAIPQPVKHFVATARRVPWRRLQMEDLDGPFQLWIEPGHELT